MSAALKETKTIDDKILLLVERDIPNIQEDISDMRDTCEKQSTDIQGLKTDVEVVKSKFVAFEGRWDTAVEVAEKQKDCIDELGKDVTAVRTTVESLAKSLDVKTVAWYQKFEYLLIVILVLAILGLSGVKAYSDILKILVPGGAIATAEVEEES